MYVSNVEPLLYSYPDAMKRLGNIGRNTLFKLIDEGMLARVHVGRRAFITAASIDAYVASLVEADTNGKEG